MQQRTADYFPSPGSKLTGVHGMVQQRPSRKRNHVREEHQPIQEPATLVYLQTRRPGGDEAEAVGDVEDLRLDPVEPAGEEEAEGVEAVVDYGGSDGEEEEVCGWCWGGRAF